MEEDMKKHQSRTGWEENASKRFINPYNFVSLGKNKNYISEEANSVNENKKTYTGMLQCRMITKTPIFIPNSSCDHAFITTKENELHKNYDFFSYSNLMEGEARGNYKNPVIPGSEIRGMLRSVYEVLSNSCLSSIQDKKLTGRITIPKKPGIVEYRDGKLTLYAANRIPLQTYKNEKRKRVYKLDVKKGTIIGDDRKEHKNNTWVKIEFGKNERFFDNAREVGTGRQPGILYIGEAMERKTKDAIFIKRGVSSKDYEKIKAAMEKMEELLEVYRDETVNIKLKEKEHEGGKHFGYPSVRVPSIPKKDQDADSFTFAVWFEEQAEHLYFAPACISRTAYYNTLRQFYKGYEPCENTKNLCKACQLFGMVQDRAAHSSAIRISDAKLCNLPEIEDMESYLKQSVYYPSDDGYITLKILASPKSSAKEFYLKQPFNCLTWNYDFKTLRYDGMNVEGKWLNEGEKRIRGRKFYWHNPNMKFSEEIPNELNVSVRPLQEKSQFSFRVYFEQITEEQLKELIWTITLGDNNESGDHCHKIGMGKPLGMGSVKLVVDQIAFRRLKCGNGTVEYNIVTSDSKDYDINIYPDIENPFQKVKEEAYYKELMTITDFHALDNYLKKDLDILSYPLGYDSTAEEKNREAIHQWFSGNRKIDSKNEMKETICYTLPEILNLEKQKDISLPKLQKNR